MPATGLLCASERVLGSAGVCYGGADTHARASARSPELSTVPPAMAMQRPNFTAAGWVPIEPSARDLVCFGITELRSYRDARRAGH
jgi:hypothetical protein